MAAKGDGRGTIISLCDKTGIMVKPWADAGYDCICIDVQHSMQTDHVDGNITKRWADVRTLTPSDLPEPAAIFGFPPCTNLAVSGARWFKRKGLRGFIDGLELVDKCRELCEWYGCPWMIENPVGRLSTAWRKPDSIFQPWEYGDLWRKKTCIWHGNGFKFPKPKYTEEPEGVTNKIWEQPPGPERANIRSETPPKFAKAVWESNKRAVSRYMVNHA
jgi:hypothetical protein